MSDRHSFAWPGGRRFAFSIIDDTDQAVVAKVAPFYDALRRYGLTATKTIWPVPTPEGDPFWAQSLADEEYRNWLHRLAADGFEIASHGARSGGSPRAITQAALEAFRSEFGEYPATYANHAQNEECLYWGVERFDLAPIRLVYRRLRKGRTAFFGSTPHSDYYWGDLCRDAIKYVRNFTFKDVVTTACDPYMPYHDPRRPMARAWFSASEAADAHAFIALLSPANLDRLEASGGACVVYTHVASGFVRDGVLDPRIDAALARLALRSGWFAPVRAVLEHMERRRGLHRITRLEHALLELRWAGEHLSNALDAALARGSRALRRPRIKARVSETPLV